MNQASPKSSLGMGGEDLCRMSAVLRHRLRNHSAGIKSAIGLLQEELRAKAPPAVLEYFPLIVGECQNVEDMVTRLGLLFDPPVPGGPERLRTLLEVVAADVRREFPRTELAVELEPAAGDAYVPGGPAALTALREIARNAAEAGGKTRRVAIDGRTESPGLALIRISDAGRGLGDGDAEKAFLPFFTTKSKHIGIGLTIARRMIDACGGAIRLDPAHPGGLQVLVTLPVLAPAGGEKKPAGA